MTDKKIIKNASTGYGYHYASLADFARQDVNIPQMTTFTTKMAMNGYKERESLWSLSLKA